MEQEIRITTIPKKKGDNVVSINMDVYGADAASLRELAESIRLGMVTIEIKTAHWETI